MSSFTESEKKIELLDANEIVTADNELNIDNDLVTNTEQYKQLLAASSFLSPKQNYMDEQVKLDLQKQLEYYFSSKNLQNDNYLRSQMDQDDYAPISLIAQFKRIKQHTNDVDLIISVIKQSTQLQLDPSNTKVRSIGGSAGGSITISFNKKLNKSFVLNDSKNLNPTGQQQRCVLILRDVASEATLEQVKDLFTNKEPNCPPCHQCESAGNDSWYVTFNNEDQAQKALQYLKGEVQVFMDKPIRARIKAHTTIPRSTSSLLNKINTISPSSPPPLSQTPTNFNTSRTQTPPVTFNQQIISYDTPPSSSYMSQTSSPSPANNIYPSVSEMNNPGITYHDGLQLVVQKPEYDNQVNASLSSQSQINYLNFNNNQQHIKYLPNSKQLGLIGNQQYLFSPGAMNSSNGARPILLPNSIQQNNQYWQLNNNQIFAKTNQGVPKYNTSSSSVQLISDEQTNNGQAITSPVPTSIALINKQASTSNLSLNNIETNQQKTEPVEELSKLKINEIYNENAKNYASPNPIDSITNEPIFQNQAMNHQPILQLPNYYQTHHQQQQMIQIPLNSNNYNRSSPAAIQAYYQSMSQSPSQQQQFIPIIPGTNNGQNQPASLLSSASSSSLNSSANNQTGPSSAQQIPFANLPGAYSQPQFIIQNSQYLNHQNANQSAQISLVNNNNGQMSGVNMNQNFYNSNSNNTNNKSSTPTPAGQTSSGSSSNTLSGSSNGPQQITSPPIYTNPYFITTNLSNLSINNNANNNNNSNGTVVSAAALNAAYQYYQACNNALNTGYSHQNQQQQYNNAPNNQNQSQLNSYNSLSNVQQQQSHLYPTNQQHQQQPVPIFYELIQPPQFDSSQNPIPLAAFQQANLASVSQGIQLQTQSQTNLSNEALSQLAKSSISTSAATAQSSIDNSTIQAPISLGNLIQHQQSIQSQHNSTPVIIYPNSNLNHQNNYPQHNLIIAPNASTSQLLMTTLGNATATNQSHHVTANPSFNNQSSVQLNHSSSNSQRRTNSGNANNSGVSDLRNVSFNNQNHNNSSHYQINTHRTYNANSRIKYSNNEANTAVTLNANQHHNNHHQPLNVLQSNNSPSSYQSNKVYHQSTSSSNAHSVISESTNSSSRSSTSNTPMTVANLNDTNNSKSNDEANNNLNKNENEKLTTITKSPPNNTDLVSFPPLLNPSNIPVNNQQRQTAPSSNSAASTTQLNDNSELASVQLDPAIICISNTGIPSTPAIINANPANKFVKQAGNLNKILISASSDQSSNEKASSMNNPVNNLTNPTTTLSTIKHHQGNLKQYELIKSHLGFNRTTHLSTSSNPDYYAQQKHANTSNQHHNQIHNQQANNQIYNNSMYKSGSSGTYSRKSIDGIHSQNNNQRVHSHHGMNPGTPNLSAKFFTNNDRNSGGNNKNNHNNRQNFSNHQQINQTNNSNTVDNKNSTPVTAISSVINSDSNQHFPSPSFNRKQKGSYQNKSQLKEKNENNQKNLNLNTQINPQLNESSNSLQLQSNSLLMSSSSSIQINDDDINSLNSNSWNKKLTFAEIVQQKSNAANGSEGNKSLNQNSQLIDCSSNASSVSVSSSQATTPTLQPQINSPFPLASTITTSFSDSDPSTNEQSQKLTCFTLNQSNSSIQV